MKNRLHTPIAGIALALLLSGTAAYSQDAAPAPTNDSAPQKAIQLVGARASLSKTLDAKKAKQGDPVTAKLQDTVKIPDATDLPKNTLLVGHVDQVQASENKSDSSIQVTFDKAQLKGGQEIPVKATIMKIAPPMNAMNSDPGVAAPAPSAMPSSPSPAAPSGGSTGGSSTASAPAPQPSMPSAMPDTSSSQPPQGSGSDVAVKSDIHDSNSGTFTAKGKNVHVLDGTTLQLAVAVIPPNTKIQ